MAYTALTGTDNINMARLNSIFAELDASIAGSSLEGEAGENLSERDMVYLASDGTWYQIDTDATGSIAVGAVKGCVVESGGISSAGTGTIRLFGKVAGFSGLTAWGKVYAGTTAGSYTQTRPNPSDGGGQVAIVEMGLAVSTTEIFINPQKAIYAERETLADDGTLTIEHHADAQTRVREVRAYVATTVAGTSHASYSDSNQDSGVNVEGPTLSGDSIDTTASGAITGIGDVSNTENARAQSFTPTNGGQLTEFTFDLGANFSSPTGDLTWKLTSDNSGDPDPGNIIATGTKTPTASATNAVSLSDGPILSGGTLYWLWLEADNQSTDNRYQLVSQTGTSSYAGGQLKRTEDGGSTWDTISSLDAQFTFTISAVTEKDKLAQGFQVTGSQTVDKVRLYLKKTGTPTGTMTCRIETDSAGDPSGTLADANATVDVAESGLGTSYAYVDFDFSTNFSISGSTQYHLVLSTDRAQSDTNYVTWGCDSTSPGYTDGEGKSELAASWSSESVDFIFKLMGPATDYDEPLGIGTVTGDSEEIGVRFDDGADANDDTMTTFKNLTGASADICCEVVL